jgi:hypothetical protein
MPKQKGPIKLKGTLNGICYYSLKGVYISRVAKGPSRERINTDPAFAKIKANNLEFGMGSKLSKAIRTGFLETTKQFQDTYMASRLSGVCRNIIQKGSGPLGKREAHIGNNPQALIGFQLNKQLVFNQIHTAKPVVTSHNNRRLITVTIPKSKVTHLHKQPKNATHFQLTCALSLVSNYQCQPDEETYKPVIPKQNALGISQQTPPLLCKIEHTNLQIQLQTPVTTELQTNVSITVWLGIQYLKLNESTVYTYKNVKAMQCIAIL